MTTDRDTLRLGVYTSALAASAALASGPLGLALVFAVRPQPPWVNARVFAANFHSIQLVPYLCGFGLIAGFLGIVISAHAATGRARSGYAVAFATVFAGLICLNYILQTCFVPALAREAADANASLIAAFSMSHPGSLGWALEMWGYAWLGAATWLIAPFFEGGRMETATRWLFVVNGPLSIAGALLTLANPGWESTTAGLVAFAAWNLVAVSMAAGAFVVFRGRLRGHTGSVTAPRFEASDAIAYSQT